ncbi:AMP-binding protein [Arcobacter sp. F2176]|uniref:AMP-binding protein n=1 Tax=Arcobacter sp. F2176 TaxID=2044511 RepID=UPI00100AAF9B|nr:AMP-binding protein [Arcobacter sp. F2176]RXJ81155.1 hypothetical protein CRU95_08060 [Arcobacter sp. F2176]
MKNLGQVLEYYALKYPEKVAIRFLARGEDETDSITYLQLKQQSHAIATQLLTQYKRGDTALLIFDASIDVIVAFWGCVYAGIIAVPIPIPNGNKGMDNVAHIVEDAEISLIISHTSVESRLSKKFKENIQLKRLNWLIVNKKNFKENIFLDKEVFSSNQLLLLQYTSGSTNKPKGVKVSHQNMIAHQEGLKEAFYSDEKSVVVSWLPYYHDMGLIGKIIHATFCGATLILMPPIAFVQNPFRWLQAISKYQGTNSAAPNFAYEDCLRNITNEQLSQLNLSSWKVAWNAAEPIHANTVVNFCNRFSQCGFNPQSLTTAYGMAESTLAISVADIKSKLKLLAIDENEFKQGNIKVIKELFIDSNLEEISQYKKVVVDCGNCISNHQIKIVDPKNRLLCSDYKIGEVWFSGKSVANGYWKKETLSQSTFFATIQNSNNSETYLRTEDMGFMDKNKNLFIVGRHKDMIIIHGENYAPQDLEFSIFNSHEAFVESGCSAFSVMSQGKEKVVIVQEIKRTQRKKVDFEKLLSHVKNILSQEYQLQLFALVFIHQANLPKTTSGKVQRKLCKHLFINEEFSPLYSWVPQQLDEQQLLNEKVSEQNLHIESSSNQLSYEKLIHWLEEWIQKTIPAIDSFEKSSNFSSYGMDSKTTALMAYDLESYIGYELDPTLCWNYPNPDTLINHLIDEIKTNQLIPLKGNLK